MQKTESTERLIFWIEGAWKFLSFRSDLRPIVTDSSFVFNRLRRTLRRAHEKTTNLARGLETLTADLQRRLKVVLLFSISRPDYPIAANVIWSVVHSPKLASKLRAFSMGFKIRVTPLFWWNFSVSGNHDRLAAIIVAVEANTEDNESIFSQLVVERIPVELIGRNGIQKLADQFFAR